MITRIDGWTRVHSGDDSQAYRSSGCEPAPQITIGKFRVRLSIEEAESLAESLTSAIRYAKGLDPKATVFIEGKR